MTRIDMATSEWHKLIKPVLPHASTDKELPERCVVNIEAARGMVYAVASDGATLAAERLRVRDAYESRPVHVRATEAAASLKLFPFGKDDDPILQVAIATVPVPVDGNRAAVSTMAVTVSRHDGTRLVMHDQRDPSRDPLASWRKTLYSAVTRERGRPLNGLDLRAAVLARWTAAARGGERLCLYTGPEPGAPLLVLVEDHFAGVWAIPQYLEAPGKRLAESPWISELHMAPAFLATASGDLRTVDVNVGTGEVRPGDDGPDGGDEQ